ncbi:cytochrome P450 3A24-like isoform X2 [Amblyomma americanum]
MAVHFGWQEWTITTAVACILFFLFYLYASRKRNYWKNQNVVSEPFSVFFGSTFRLLFTPLHEMDAARYKKYGQLFGVFEMGKAVLFVADPKLVKDVLVKDFKSLPNRRTANFNEPLLDNVMSMADVEKWQKVRPASIPAFSVGALRKMVSLIEDCALVTTEHLKGAASREENIDLKLFFWDYTMDVTARCVFATRLDSHSDRENEFVTRSKQILPKGVTLRILLIIIFPKFAKMIGLSLLPPGVLQFFRDVLQRIINNKSEEQEESFFRLLMNAHEERGGNTAESSTDRDNRLFNLNSDIEREDSSGTTEKLTEEEAMAQCILFFIGGQEKAGSAIAFTLYLLAVHPDVQEKLRKEVDECFTAHGDRPGFDEVNKLEYLHCVVSESLRMYPPVPRLERAPCQDYVFGDTGIKVNKDDIVTVPVYALHHDPQYFPDPLTFNPERFNEQNMASIQPYTYLPFGAGPRNCIATHFALHTVKLCVLHTIRNVLLVRTEQTKVPLEFRNGYGMLTAKGIEVGVRKRE